MKKTKSQLSHLTHIERLSAIISAIILFAIGLWLLRYPPSRTDVEVSSKEWRIGDSTIDASVFIGGLGLVAAVIFLYGVNGVRIVKFGAGSIVVEGGGQERDAEKLVDGLVSDDATSAAEINPAAPLPEPKAPVFEEIQTGKGTFEMFQTNEIPGQVLKDAMEKWDDLEMGTPTELEFGLRKKGRGNYPWILRFRDRPPIIVSYGGLGKVEATVKKGG